MAHQDQFEFIGITRDNFPDFFRGTRVLEVGSLDINGSIRRHFDACDYVGIDVGPGPGVDLVVAGQHYAAPTDSFDVVVSCECMEHNPAWRETTANMIRVLRPGGLFLLTCAAPGRPEHGTIRTETYSSPLTAALGQTYYGNLHRRDFEAAGLLQQFGVRADWVNWRVHDYYLSAIKGSSGNAAWSSYTKSVTDWLAGFQPRRTAALKDAVLRLTGEPGVEFFGRLLARLKKQPD